MSSRFIIKPSTLVSKHMVHKLTLDNDCCHRLINLTFQLSYEFAITQNIIRNGSTIDGECR